MDETLIPLGVEIQHHLDRLGWSRNRLAEEARIGNSTVSRLMRGLQPATHDKIEAIAQALQVDPARMKELGGLYVGTRHTERDPRVEFIAERLDNLAPHVREEAIRAVGAVLDSIHHISQHEAVLEEAVAVVERADRATKIKLIYDVLRQIDPAAAQEAIDELTTHLEAHAPGTQETDSSA
jgi:transcriptional regulator with XRE-family HTH domain